MEILTFATHISGYYDALLQSARNNGYNVKTLCFGEEWKGLMDKFLKMKHYLSNQPDHKIIIFLDGFDTIVLRNANECKKLFQHIHQDGKVLVSACPSTFIISYLLFGGVHNKDKNEYFNALNTGMYMGYVKDLKKLFDTLEPYMVDTTENDQRMLTQCYVDERCEPYIQLDTHSQIFYNLEWQENPWVSYTRTFLDHGEYKAQLNNDYYTFTNDIHRPLYIKKTNTHPFFLQANMNANIDEIVDVLHLSTKKYNSDYDAYSASTYRQHLKKKVISFFVFVIHLFINYLMIFHAFVSWNPLVLLFILWLQVIILVQWYVLGGCILSEYEKHIHGNDKKNYKGGSVSATAFCCERIFNLKTEDYDVFTTYYPIFYCAFICIKLYLIFSKCKKLKKKINVF